MNVLELSAELRRLSQHPEVRWIRVSDAFEVVCFTGNDAILFMFDDPLESTEAIRIIARNVRMLAIRGTEAWGILLPFIENAVTDDVGLGRSKKDTLNAVAADLKRSRGGGVNS